MMKAFESHNVMVPWDIIQSEDGQGFGRSPVVQPDLAPAAARVEIGCKKVQEPCLFGCGVQPDQMGALYPAGARTPGARVQVKRMLYTAGAVLQHRCSTVIPMGSATLANRGAITFGSKEVPLGRNVAAVKAAYVPAGIP